MVCGSSHRSWIAFAARFDRRVAMVSGRSISHLNGLFPAPRRSGLHARKHGSTKLADGRLEVERANRSRRRPRGGAPFTEASRTASWSRTSLRALRSISALPPMKRRRRRFMDDACRRDTGWTVQRGKMVVELRAGGPTRATRCAPSWRNRRSQAARPVFVGDDVTDEDGFRGAPSIGRRRASWSARRATTAARYRLPVVAAVARLAAVRARERPRLWPIGNCQVSALIDAGAGFVWGCLPRVDGDPPSARCSTRGESADAGRRMADRAREPGRGRAAYLTQHADPGDAARPTRRRRSPRSIDFCPRFERSGRMYRPVAFVRIVRPVAGAPRLRVAAGSGDRLGRRRAERTSGSNHIRFL